MIRRAKPQDIQKALPLALEALRTERYPTLVVSQERIEAMMRECVSSAQHFALVCEHEGEIVGALGAFYSPGLWHERGIVSVAMFFCRKPGEGVAMIREFLRWARARPVIKMIQFTLEFDGDARIAKLLQRMGLKAACPVYMEVK